MEATISCDYVVLFSEDGFMAGRVVACDGGVCPHAGLLSSTLKVLPEVLHQ
ncbi:MAG: hypothetical protein Q7J45_01415 [bacterium]|nr:hypothetical protein [bacterium]